MKSVLIRPAISAAALLAVSAAAQPVVEEMQDYPVGYETPAYQAWSEPAPGRARTFTPNPRRPERLWGGPQLAANRQPTGALTGVIVYCSAGHGWTSDNEDIRPADGDRTWYTMRGNYNNVVEDYGNNEQLNAFANYIANAGGTVVPFRPLGYQTNEVVLDNDDPQVTYTGGWTTSTSTIFYGSTGDTAPFYYTAAAPTQTATARYTPNLPQAGYYPVYCWTRWGSDRVNQLYRTIHTGGATDMRVNHRMVGQGWVWLGNYWFNAGTQGYVEVSNASPTEAGVVVADAIRFGNGMGDIDRGYGVSGFARELENSRYWVQRAAGQGTTTTLYDLPSPNDDQNDNVGAPPRMSAHMNNEGVGTFYDRIYIGFHSNAGVSPNTYGLYNSAYPLTGQQAFAQAVNDEIMADCEALDGGVAFTPDYVTPRANGLIGSDYGEIRATYFNYEMTGTIAEVASHESVADGLVMRDPRGRMAIGRASYHAIVKFLNANTTVPLTFLPEPPVNVRAINAGGGSAFVAWDAPAADPAGAQAPTGYVVYRSTDGLGFGSPTVLAGVGNTTATITGLGAGQTYHFRVAATNAGGESLQSETIALRTPTSGAASVLLVNGFDRFDVGLSPNETVTSNIISTSGGGSVFPLIRPLRMNGFDYTRQHAQALAGCGRAFDCASNEAVATGRVALAPYAAVVWILGEESTVDRTFDATERALVQSWLNAGAGRGLFVTGSEIGWELDAQAVSTAFYNGVLKADYVSDDANTYQASGVAGSIFDSVVLFGFDPANGSPYDANYPDRIAAFDASATPCLSYVGGTGGTAAIQASVATPAYKVVMFGFPFECIVDTTVRTDLMNRVMNWFGVNVPVVLSHWELS
jgi:hypothetical protein